MTSDIEIYLEHLESMIGVCARYSRITERDELPPIWSIQYLDVPETGYIAGFTYGLSSSFHPEWRLGRPELMICVQSVDVNWCLAIGVIAKRLRGTCPFSYGSILRFGERISTDSRMSGFAVFAPSIIERNQAQIQLSNRTVNLVQLYPIYEEEIPLIELIGVPAFVTERVEDLYDVNRPPAMQ